MTAVEALEAPSVSRFVAAELRAEIARAGISQSEVARRMGVPGAWISRRLAPTPAREVDLTFEEVDHFCGVIGSDPEAVIVRALRACRDSNPKPSDLEPVRLRIVPGPPIARPAGGAPEDATLRVGSEPATPVGRAPLRLAWSVQPGFTPDRRTA